MCRDIMNLKKKNTVTRKNMMETVHSTICIRNMFMRRTLWGPEKSVDCAKSSTYSLPELDRVKWVQLQIDYELHFFSSLEPMTSVDLDHLIIQLWQKVFEDLSGEPDALQVRAVSCHCVACLKQIGSPTTGKLDQWHETLYSHWRT